MLEQVQRIGGNMLQDEHFFDKAALRIAGLLDLTKGDILLDACCGNGLITSRMQKYCSLVQGVDFSESLIRKANESYPGVDFFCSDIESIHHYSMLHPELQTADKIHLGFSFQYFESISAGKRAIEALLAMLRPGGRILLSDIPDRSLFFSYYSSPSEWIRLWIKMLKNKNDMGKFWSEEELLYICNSLGVHGTKLRQEKNLPYAHYRMDFMIWKDK